MASSTILGKWVVGDLLGEGGFSKVMLGEHQKTGEKAALKILEKKSGDSINSSERKQVESEIDAMKKIKHKNVIQMKDFNLDMVYLKKQVILVVLELAPGGELFEYLSFTGAFEEIIARTYFHQLMSGIKAAHDMKICHRDLKPENLLMDANFTLKIADFGFAHTMQNKNNLYTECGTTSYMAPEMFSSTNKGGYDGASSDVWACSVILFIMIAGFPPYQKPDGKDWWFNKLLARKYERFWAAHCRTAYFPEDLKDLINKMFTVDPQKRISVDDILKHPWYTKSTIKDTDLKKKMQDRKDIVDQENAKLKVQRQQEQQAGGYSSGAVRDIGDENNDDPESDDLPTTSPASIILKDDGKDDGEGSDEDKDVIESGIPLEDEEEEEDKGPAPKYKPPVNANFTKFYCSDEASEVFDGLDDVLGKLSIEHKSDGYQFECTFKDLTGPLNFVANVYTHPENEKKSIVECKKGKGNGTAYRQIYAKIRNRMDAFAEKQEKPSTAPAEKTEEKKN